MCQMTVWTINVARVSGERRIPEAQVQFQKRNPGRVVLFVKGNPAAPVCRIGLGARSCGRLSAHVDDLDARLEQNSSAARANGGAEIDVLCVHEEALVEKANRLRVVAAHEKARAADPI